MRLRNILLFSLLALLLLAGCIKRAPTSTPPPRATPELATALPPTPTQAPMALLVNGEGITLDEYNAEISRLQMALTEINQEMTPEEQKQRVLDNFINELLLAQSATQAGHVVPDEEVQSRIDKLVVELGSAEKLTEWQVRFGYTDQSFRDYLKRSILVAWQRDQVAGTVPQTAEQIHARQLIYQVEASAVDTLTKLQSGTKFSYFAKIQDPVLEGDLGWFPRGVLTQPEVEEVVFALQPGEISGVIKSGIGYHIMEVIERDPEYPLSVEARRILQEAALDAWLVASKASSTIEILIP